MRTLAMTDTPLLPIARDATVVLTADFAELWYFFSVVAVRRRERGETCLEEAESIYREFDIFHQEE